METLRGLDLKQGKSPIDDSTGFGEPLPDWYRSVRDTPLADLGIRDICIACRQGIHPEHIVPLALSRLEREPFAGHNYDGELIVAIGSVPARYWNQRTDELAQLLAIIERAMRAECDLPREIEDTRGKLSTLLPHERG